MFAEFGFRGGREDRFFQAGGFFESCGEGKGADGLCFSVFDEAGAGEVAADYAFDWDHVEGFCDDCASFDGGGDAQGVGGVE